MTDGARYARISDLVAAYAVLVDSRQAEAWADLFTDDGVLEFGGRRVEGREALVTFAKESPRGVHLSSPVTLSEAGDDVTARSTFTFVAGDRSRLMAGRYTDVVVDDGTRARFVHRSIEITVSVPLAPAASAG